MLKIKWSRITIVILCLTIGGCATTSAPVHTLASPDEVPMDVYGGWIEVERMEGQGLDGELLAVENDSLYIMVADSVFRVLSKDNIVSAKLTAYNMQQGIGAGTVFLGALSGVSHGFYGIITIPAWTILGSIIVNGHTKEAQRYYPSKATWGELNLFARYPQGMPDLDPALITFYNRDQ